jgi:SAM-dependent methyltransferase
MQTLKMAFSHIDLAMKQRTELYHNVGQQYTELIAKEAEELIGLLPLGHSRVLDIGAGLAAYWILVDKNSPVSYKVDLLDFCKVDATLGYGFKTDGFEAYNHFDLVEELFKTNHSRAMLGDFHDANELEFDSTYDGYYDCVVSLYSWCYHYPFATYADLVARVLRRGGTLIVDVRNQELPVVQADDRFHLVSFKAHKQAQRLTLRRA